MVNLKNNMGSQKGQGLPEYTLLISFVVVVLIMLAFLFKPKIESIKYNLFEGFTTNESESDNQSSDKVVTSDNTDVPESDNSEQRFGSKIKEWVDGFENFSPRKKGALIILIMAVFLFFYLVAEGISTPLKGP